MKIKAAFKFRPWSLKQKKVLNWWMPGSPYADWDGIICDGAIRSGKTIAFIVGFVLWSTTCFTGENFIISGRSIGALKRNLINPMLKILRSLNIEYEYNRSEHYLEFGGNTYYLFGANNEASQDVLQGITAAGWLGDEVALQPQSFVEQAIGRCSVDGSKLWLNCNPENPNHHVKLELIDKAVVKRLLHLHFELDDNLTLSAKIKERYRRMFSGVWYKRFILGLWVAAEGAIYDMFDEDVHVVDKHPDITQYWVACDYGTTNPTVFLLIGKGIDGAFYVVDEWRHDSRKAYKQMTDAQYADAMESWLESHGIFPQHIIIDPSAASFIQECKSGARRHLTNIKGADNAVVDGIRRTSTLFTISKLFVCRKCKGLISEILGYLWDTKAQQKRGEDEPVKKDDHGPDALRYFVNHVCGRRGELRTWT